MDRVTSGDDGTGRERQTAIALAYRAELDSQTLHAREFSTEGQVASAGVQIVHPQSCAETVSLASNCLALNRLFSVALPSPHVWALVALHIVELFVELSVRSRVASFSDWIIGILPA